MKDAGNGGAGSSSSLPARPKPQGIASYRETGKIRLVQKGAGARQSIDYDDLHPHVDEEVESTLKSFRQEAVAA